MFESLEKCISTHYQYLVEEFESGNNALEISLYFRKYCEGCIAMYKELNPNVEIIAIRPFFHEIIDPRPLQSINEVHNWVNGLVFKLENELQEKNA